MCKTGRALSVTVKAGRILWCCHRQPVCPRADLRDALARLLPGCLASLPKTRPRRDAVPRAELEKLIGMSGAALELRVACLAWNCTPQAAAEKLGMPARTYRRAVTAWPNLARNPR